MVRYAMIRNRTQNTDYNRNTGYKGIKLLVGREEFITWFMPQDYKGCSVDRIDNKGHYELSNMQIIPLKINMAKDRTKMKNGIVECYACKEEKEKELFVKDKRRMNGYSTICLDCERKRWSSRRKKKQPTQEMSEREV